MERITLGKLDDLINKNNASIRSDQRPISSQPKGVDLTGIHISFMALCLRMKFNGSDIRGSYFNSSNFYKCDFSGADMRGMEIHYSKFIECDFSGVSLMGTKFTNTKFIKCNFAGADIRGVKFKNCFMDKSNFYGINFNGADLIDCDFIGCKPDDTLRSLIMNGYKG